MSLEPPGEDAAALAFEQLRQEVAQLRRAVEGLAEDGGRRSPDYSPTLSRLGKAIATVDERVQALAQAPVVALTPEQLRQLLQRAADAAVRPAAAELGRGGAALEAAVRRLDEVGQAARAHLGRWRLAIASAALGIVVGAAVWASLLGPVARLLPASWQAPERLAAATLALPRDLAGARLVSGAAPDLWRRLQLGAALISADPAAAQACEARATVRRQAVRCVLQVRPANGAEETLSAGSSVR